MKNNESYPQVTGEVMEYIMGRLKSIERQLSGLIGMIDGEAEYINAQKRIVCPQFPEDAR